jgi:hypothetical protein
MHAQEGVYLLVCSARRRPRSLLYYRDRAEAQSRVGAGEKEGYSVFYEVVDK